MEKGELLTRDNRGKDEVEMLQHIAAVRNADDVSGDPQDPRGEEDAVSPDEFELMFRRFAQEPIPVRVCDVKVEGNSKTRVSVIEAHLERLKNAGTTRELLREAAHAVTRIESMGLFEKCIIFLEAGPVHGSVNVVVKVQEGTRPCSLGLAIFSKPEDQKRSLGGSIEWKNLLGYGETWDGTGNYGCDGNYEMSAGLHFPRYKGLPTALVTRAAFFTPDWLKFSSYKMRLAGISVGLLSDKHQDLSYNLTWQTLQDSDHSDGQVLLPIVKYAFKIDERDSVLRPTRGYAFRIATQLAGVGLDVLQYSARQDIDFRFAIPLGFYKAALNIGLSGGFMLPWTKDFFRKTTFTSDRFFMGRHSSLVCDMNGPTTILGLGFRGMESTKLKRSADGTETSDSRDHLGGGLAVTGFADLSFDLPLGFLRQKNLHGHCFLCASNLIGLTEADRRSLSFQGFLSSFKCFAGAGIVIPTRFFRLEVNFCQTLGHFLNDSSKRGVQLSFSSPR